jgi:positive regulator of sigma E activity
MRRKGRVIAAHHSQATVCFEPRETCEKCDASQFCQGRSARQTIVAQNQMGACVDDEVHVEQSPGIGFISAFLLFGVPVLLAVIGLVVGSRWGESIALLIGISSFVLGLVIAKLVNNFLARRALFLPKIVNIVRKEGS